MKTSFAFAIFVTLASASPALASTQARAVSLTSLEAAVKADAVAHGLVVPSKIVVTGDSFTILSAINSPPAKLIQRVMASGTVDRSTGKVTSYNPILMD